MSEAPNMTQSSTSASGLESSFDMLLVRALEKVVSRAIDQINEAIDEAIDKAVKKAVENVLEKAVENVVERAVERSMAKHLDRSQELVSSQLTGQQDARQNVLETDVVSEIPETQQESMEIETVAENIAEANVEDDSEHEMAAWNDLFAGKPDYTRHNPWPEDTFVIDMFNNFKILLAVNKDMQPAFLPRESARGEQLKMCLWEGLQADGWLHIRNPLTEKFLGIHTYHQPNGERQFLLDLFDNMNKETRFSLRSGIQVDTHLLQVPIANELHSMEAMLVGVHRQDFIVGEIHSSLSERFEKAIHIVRCSQDLEIEPI